MEGISSCHVTRKERTIFSLCFSFIQFHVLTAETVLFCSHVDLNWIFARMSASPLRCPAVCMARVDARRIDRHLRPVATITGDCATAASERYSAYTVVALLAHSIDY